MKGITNLVIDIACDKCLNQFFPTVTGSTKNNAFRTTFDRQPFGFDFNGSPIEVHVTYKMKGTRMTPVLSVWGVMRDGRLHLIGKDIVPTERF